MGGVYLLRPWRGGLEPLLEFNVLSTVLFHTIETFLLRNCGFWTVAERNVFAGLFSSGLGSGSGSAAHKPSPSKEPCAAIRVCDDLERHVEAQQDRHRQYCFERVAGRRNKALVDPCKYAHLRPHGIGV